LVALTSGQALAHGAKHHRSGATPASSGHTHRHHHTLLARILHRHHGRAGTQYAYAARVIQCVAFAKQDAGIMISGNARDWWARAAGIYERGGRPEPGSVLSFRSTGRMPLGHVAVVSGVQDSRTILIDQSHWNSRGITRDIEVKDVSENNDWTAVRVQLRHGGDFGSIYPTHGFIYPRPARDRGTESAAGTPLPEGSGRAKVIRVAAHVSRGGVEVAEAPETGKALDLTVPGISFDAPNRSLR
jgi:surface antigen